MEFGEYTNEGLREIQLRPVERSEEAQYQEQMARHHYLGALNKIGETIWYVATWREQWVAQLSLSAAARKSSLSDRQAQLRGALVTPRRDGKRTRVTASHVAITFADMFLKKKTKFK